MINNPFQLNTSSWNHYYLQSVWLKKFILSGYYVAEFSNIGLFEIANGKQNKFFFLQTISKDLSFDIQYTVLTQMSLCMKCRDIVMMNI